MTGRSVTAVVDEKGTGRAALRPSDRGDDEAVWPRPRRWASAGSCRLHGEGAEHVVVEV